MSKESFVIFLGLVVLLVPSLGVPREYKEWLLIACGVLLMITGYRLRRNAFLKSLERENGERGSDAFVENTVGQKITLDEKGNETTP